MWKMSAFQLGVLVFALCLTTQVLSQNSTLGNSTMSPTMSSNSTQSAGPYSSSTNGTTAKGAGVGLRVGPGALLAPVLIVLHRHC